MAQSRHLAGATLLLLGLAACSDDRQPAAPTAAPALAAARAPETTNDYILILPEGGGIPSTLGADVARSGGTLTGVQAELGLAYATSTAPDFQAKAEKIRGVQSAVRDVLVQWAEPDTKGETIEAEAAVTDAAVGADAVYGMGESFSNAQWNAPAIKAPEAWAAGYRGKGARVAIIDGGIRDTHIDLTANLDKARSASFVPGQPYNTDTGTFWHGTHVAGIVAAAVNGAGTTGIAPEATIIGVKALHSGSGQFTWINNAIYYAATPIQKGGAGAHIINMSLGATLPKQGNKGGDPDQNTIGLLLAQSRATSYARKQGVLVIASAGNEATDLDHVQNVVKFPAEAVGVLSISALGPYGFYVPGNTTSPDRLASYSNYGQSSVDLGAPGGDFAWPTNAVCSVPRLPTGTLAQVCWAMDMVLSTSRGSGTSNTSYSWAAGTSMASPAAAGVAALIVGKYGPMEPAQLEAKLKNTADDLGKPGNDDAYGQGRVNAYRAVTE